MGVYIVSAGSVMNQAAGSMFQMIINPDGSINIGSISQNITVTSAANRSGLISQVYTASSGVTTNLSGNSIPNDFNFVVKAFQVNSDYIGIGSATSLFAQSGLRLYPGQAVRFGLDNTNRVSFVTRVNNDGVEVFSET